MSSKNRLAGSDGSNCFPLELLSWSLWEGENMIGLERRQCPVASSGLVASSGDVDVRYRDQFSAVSK